MEDLHLDTIPSELLARILLQLHTLPPTKQFSDSVNILSAGLNKYGHTGDLNAFLEYCASLTLSSQETWAWNYYEINHDLDWDSAKLRKPQEIIGLRFLIASETVSLPLTIMHKYVRLAHFALLHIRHGNKSS